MDFFELHAELRVDVPAERGAEETGAEVVHAVFGIAQHDGKVFRYVFEQDMQRMHLLDDGLRVQNAVVEDVSFGFGLGKGEILRVSSAEELKGMLHDLFAAEFAAWEIVEYHFAMLLEKLFALCDPGDIVIFEF